MRAWWVLVAAACGSKSDKPDCAKYGAHMAEVTGAGLDKSRKDSVEALSKDVCENGHVSAAKASCVMAATTRDQIFECEGLAPIGKAPDKPVDTPKPPPPAAQRVKRQGFSFALPAGWVAKSDKLPPEDVLIRGTTDDQGAYLTYVASAMLGKDEAKCRAVGEQMAKKTGATFKSSQVLDSKLGPMCRTILTDPHMVIQGDSVAAPGGTATMSVTCFYALTRTDPAPYCAEIFNSLQFP